MTAASVTEPRDLSAGEWQQFDRMVQECEERWPKGSDTPNSGPRFLPDDLPGIPSTWQEREALFEAGRRRNN